MSFGCVSVGVRMGFIRFLGSALASVRRESFTEKGVGAVCLFLYISNIVQIILCFVEEKVKLWTGTFLLVIRLSFRDNALSAISKILDFCPVYTCGWC